VKKLLPIYNLHRYDPDSKYCSMELKTYRIHSTANSVNEVKSLSHIRIEVGYVSTVFQKPET